MRAAWAVLALCAGASWPSPGLAESGQDVDTLRVRGLGAPELGRISAQLGGATGARRESAFRALSELNVESVPGIEQRLHALRGRRPTPEAVTAALVAFRHAVGSRRADDSVDIAQGVLAVLAAQRDSTTLATAEPLLYLRALERIATREAGLLMAEILLLDERGVWDHELKLARSRVGLLLLPALLELRSHADARVRSWALAGVHALDMEDPELATQLPDPRLAAEVVLAYSRPLDFAAMPVVVRLVGAEKQQVREAARTAVARFGKNAIWQLRELYEELTGQAANKGWDAERTAHELYGVLDRPATEEAETLLAQGMAHYVAGELDAMRRHYDRLLAQFPSFEGRAKMAPGYSALGRKLLARDQLEPARAAFVRAVRLAPDASDAAELRAQVAFIEAELALVSGVVDLDGYDRALRQQPDLAAAADARDRLSGARAARERRYKRLAAGAAIGLLLGWIALLLRARRRAVATAASPG